MHPPPTQFTTPIIQTSDNFDPFIFLFLSFLRFHRHHLLTRAAISVLLTGVVAVASKTLSIMESRSSTSSTASTLSKSSWSSKSPFYLFSAGKTRNGFCKDPELNLRLPAGIWSIMLMFLIIIMMVFDQVYGDVHDHDHDHDYIYHGGDFHPGWQSDHRSATWPADTWPSLIILWWLLVTIGDHWRSNVTIPITMTVMMTFTWIAHQGFPLTECALVQPSYSWPWIVITIVSPRSITDPG